MMLQTFDSKSNVMYVSALNVHPVKSCKGIAMKSVPLFTLGLQHGMSEYMCVCVWARVYVCVCLVMHYICGFIKQYTYTHIRT